VSGQFDYAISEMNIVIYWFVDTYLHHNIWFVFLQHTFRRGEVYNYNRTRGVPCNGDPPVAWMHGQALMEGMKQVCYIRCYTSHVYTHSTWSNSQ